MQDRMRFLWAGKILATALGPPYMPLLVGSVVNVVEIKHLPEEKRVRGRILEPAGWISLLNTDTGSEAPTFPFGVIRGGWRIYIYI